MYQTKMKQHKVVAWSIFGKTILHTIQKRLSKYLNRHKNQKTENQSGQTDVNKDEKSF